MEFRQSGTDLDDTTYFAEVPRSEEPPFRFSRHVSRNALLYILFAFIVSDLDRLFPAPSWVETLAMRYDATQIGEFALGTGLTILGLTTAALLVVWQTTVQKFGGTFVRYVANRGQVLSAWAFAILSTMHVTVIWALTYYRGEGPNPHELRYFASFVISLGTFIFGVANTVRVLTHTVQELSPRNLLEGLTAELFLQWDSLDARSRSSRFSRKWRMFVLRWNRRMRRIKQFRIGQFRSVNATELNDAIRYAESLAKNIGKIGHTAARDGDFELLRHTLMSLKSCYMKATQTLNFISLRHSVVRAGLNHRRELKDQYWPTGLLLREIRDLLVHVLSLRDPGYTEVQVLKLFQASKNIDVGIKPLQIWHWNKFIREVFHASLEFGRPSLTYEVVETATGLYDSVMAQFNRAEGTRHFSLLIDVIGTLGMMLLYAIVSGKPYAVRELTDALIRFLRANRESATSLEHEALAQILNKEHIYPTFLDAGVLAVYEAQYVCAEEILTRMATYLNNDVCTGQLFEMGDWAPRPIHPNDSPPPLAEENYAYGYAARQFYSVWLAYAAFCSDHGFIYSKVTSSDFVFPEWFMSLPDGVRQLRQELSRKAPYWNNLFGGLAQMYFNQVADSAEAQSHPAAPLDTCADDREVVVDTQSFSPHSSPA